MSSVSAAASSAERIACAYILPVVTELACPRRFDTVVIGTPLTPEMFSGLSVPEKEKIALYTDAMREKIIQLKELADE